MKRALGSISTAVDEIDERKKRLRQDRFKDHLNLSVKTELDLTQSSHASPKRIKGLSNKLERPYLRLTSDPQPSIIRPLHILKLALENVKKKYMENEDYRFACDQLKSIRQGWLVGWLVQD
jgi:SAC3 family protein LENG8/THP3